MKHLLIVFSFLFLTPACLNSQVIISILFGDKLNSPNVEFGLTLGENFSTMSGLENSSYAPTFNLGMFFNIRLKKKLWLHPEILLKSSYGVNGLSPYATGDADLDLVLSQAEVQRRLGYINIPILMKYRTNGGFGVEAGPQLSLRRKAKDKFISSVIGEEDLLYENDIKDLTKALDFGIAFGISQKLEKRKGITLNLRYYYGLTDILKDNTGDALKNSGILLSAHVMIGKKDDPTETIE